MRLAKPILGRRSRVVWLVVLSTGLLVGADTTPKQNDAMFRPSVMVRQGKALGTGVIIASVEGETLILTASHVVEGSGSIFVELNRFNVGLERTRSSAGWPRRLAATILVRDSDADLAILEIKRELAFPYVARLATGTEPPAQGTPVTTIGFDHGDRLIGFSTRIKGVERIDMGQGGGDRPFLVTVDPPEQGRSGGGLFRSDGTLVGVCVARAELEKGRKLGLFSSLGNVRALIKKDDEIQVILNRSIRRSKLLAR